jgi:hypothetical protein
MAELWETWNVYRILMGKKNSFKKFAWNTVEETVYNIKIDIRKINFGDDRWDWLRSVFSGGGFGSSSVEPAGSDTECETQLPNSIVDGLSSLWINIVIYNFFHRVLITLV